MSKDLYQLKSESDKHYGYFKQYLATGSDRSIQNLSVDLNVSTRNLFRISKKNNWKERISNFYSQYNVKIMSDLANQQKENFTQRLQSINSMFHRMNEVNNNILAKSYSYLKSDLDPETYFKRSSHFINLMLKFQKYEKRFDEQINNFSLTSNFEEKELEYEIEQESNQTDDANDDEAQENNTETKRSNSDQAEKKIDLNEKSADKHDKICQKVTKKDNSTDSPLQIDDENDIDELDPHSRYGELGELLKKMESEAAEFEILPAG